MRGMDVRTLLEHGLNRWERKLDARLIGELASGFRAWRRGRGTPAEGDAATLLPEELVGFLQQEVEREARGLAALRDRNADFNRRYTRAATEAERRQHILDYARDLGSTRWQLREDRRAFGRWFGHDAITDRYVRRHGAAERRIAFCLKRLGAVTALLLGGAPANAGESLWRRLGLERLVRPLLGHDGDTRVAEAAFACLAAALGALPAGSQEGLVDDATLAFIYRAALDPRQPVSVQCEALRLVRALSAAAFAKVLRHRLLRPADGDDLFVRRCAVGLLGECLPASPELAELLPVAARDPSPFVRQALARALRQAPAASVRTWLRALARQDAVPQVRAAALWEGLALLRRPDVADHVRRLLGEALEQEEHEFVLRVAVHVAASGARGLVGGEGPLLAAWRQTVMPGLDRLHTQAASLAVRRWAAQARERIWCLTDPAARALHDRLRSALARVPPGRGRRLPPHSLRGLDEALVGRVLSVLAQEDFGYDLDRGWLGTRVTRGHVFGFRLWRFLHELRHSDPAKRQAFRHTIGRTSRAGLRAPSAVLSELAETKVPGEPLFISRESGWRPYLPLPDDLLSSLDRGFLAPPVHFYTSEGVTELEAPRSPWARLWAQVRLNWSFAHYARLRNWQEGDQSSPAAYLQAASKLGFRVRVRPHDDAGAADPAVLRFFPAVLPLLFLGDVWDRLWDLGQSFATYFSSVYDNTVPDLVMFTLGAMAVFYGRHWYLNFTFQRARRRLPLVVGGWGTRGKSGTERLKAALFNALGYGLVSKTTGCEAMFLVAHPYGKTREMFLYRSYDKATIWEQRNVVLIADALGAEVFLWECMGLNPSYVMILQRHWMRDDISTLTNTYPDHEDIQGPAGINIPEVMTRFIPEGSRLLTSEEQMRPILAHAAAGLGTAFRAVGWLEAGLLPPDVLKRFPYEEHPYNIALVLALADELGIDRDFALKEMADRVVPDLGVLKTSPAAALRTRRLEFSNGCSANERHGCLNNWIRLGFDRQDHEADPGVWITTVVNNRADRIPRSRVFAGILVNDISADRHFLIGGNLSGLVSYIRESWDEAVRSLTLWPESDGAASDPLRVLEAMARRFRRAVREETVRARLRIMLEALAGPQAEALEALWQDPAALRERLTAAGCDAKLLDATVEHLSEDLKGLQEYRAFAERLRQAGAGQHAELDRAFRDLLWHWFEKKIVVISNYYAPGDQIIDRICAETPPGFRNRVMGIQNIKGTGLDFVYRWEAWHACHRLCAQLRGPDPAQAGQALRELAGFHDYGLLSEAFVRETVEQVRQAPWAQREEVQAQLRLVLANLEEKMVHVREGVTRTWTTTGWSAWLWTLVEAFLDAGDAVKRRKTANRIYRDLATERISHERAALELQGLIKRQKGGWLLKKVEALQHLLRRQPKE
jgi:poly-gamma-glutamate synthase PgsB/CapB